MNVKTTVPELPRTTRALDPRTIEALAQLQPGDRIRIIQTVRISSTRQWTTMVSGVYRGCQSLVTGLATQRVPEDDIIVPTVHFTKDNGEHSSVALDEKTIIEREPAAAGKHP